MFTSFRAALPASALLLTLILRGGHPEHQSGRGLMHGYVEFEGVTWLDLKEKDVHATVELRGSAEGNKDVVYTARTDDHGSYDIRPVSMGEYTLRISFPGYRTYQTDIYIPSDFECRLAVLLKRTRTGSRPVHDTP